MDSIKKYFWHSFGLSLSDAELRKILSWYEKEGKDVPKDLFLAELQGEISVIFPEKELTLFEEDMSDVSVILAALDKAIKK